MHAAVGEAMTLLHDCSVRWAAGSRPPRRQIKGTRGLALLFYRRDGRRRKAPVWAIVLFCLLASGAVTFAIDHLLRPPTVSELQARAEARTQPTIKPLPVREETADALFEKAVRLMENKTFGMPLGTRAPDFTLER